MQNRHTFKTLILGAAAAAMLSATAMPAFADKDGGNGAHAERSGEKHGGKRHHGKRGKGRMAMQMMQRFDVNGDGELTKDEIEGVIDTLYVKADANGDGKVTLEEFKVFYIDEFSERKVRAFQRMDKNGDGEITIAEFENARPGKGGGKHHGKRSHKGAGKDGAPHAHKGKPGKRGEGNQARLEKFDTNKDGKISREERAAARLQVFTEADKNGDKVLTLAEFTPIWAARADKRMVRAFQWFDRDGDLVITKEEAHAPVKKMVRKMDSNGDGVLNKKDKPHRGEKPRHKKNQG